MTTFKYSFDKGVVGNTITVNDPLTRDDSAFSLVAATNASVNVYSSEQVFIGSASGKLSTDPSVSSSSFVAWKLKGSKIRFRVPVWHAARFTAVWDVIQFVWIDPDPLIGTKNVARVRIELDGKISIVVGASADATSATVIPVGSWVQLIGDYDFALKNANITAYGPSGAVIATVTARNLPYDYTSVDQIRMGLPVASTGLGPIYLDSVAASNDEDLGVLIPPTPPQQGRLHVMQDGVLVNCKTKFRIDGSLTV